MKTLHEWGIASLGRLTWAVLMFTVISPILDYFKKKVEQTQHPFGEILASALTTPSIQFFLGLGLRFYLDAIPDLPKKW